ncbi:MAG: low specificity L-threonine aldolase [Actinomycetes bacterium]
MTEKPTAIRRSFASDNYSGVHPELLAALARVNVGHQVAYGDDDTTAELRMLIKEHFGPLAEVFPVFNGTGANVVAMQAMSSPWSAVVCAESAHVHVDEGGAPEKVAGLKLWPVPTPDGKLTPELLDTQAWGYGDVHRAQPTVLAVTQSTELGTLYTIAELADLVERAKFHGMRVLLDGARIANAAVALGASFAEFTTDLGIDAVTFGGTKNGAMAAEAVVVLSPELASAVDYLRKSDMQLASKMRYPSAQLIALLTDDLWARNAGNANNMARRLYEGVAALDGVTVTREVQVNSVFAVLPPDVTASLQQRFGFYTWDQGTGEVRWMCSWDTTEADVDAFVAAIKTELAAR